MIADSWVSINALLAAFAAQARATLAAEAHQWSRRDHMPSFAALLDEQDEMYLDVGGEG